MNSMRNKVNLIGRLGAKPEIQTVKGGFMITRFSIATNESYKEKNGEWKEVTQWHNATIWGKNAERFVKNADKGIEVAIEGRLANSSYEAKNGEKRYQTEVEVHDFLLLVPREVKAQV